MPSISLPDDVAEHLQAAIQLSNRRVHLHLWDEAEMLPAQNCPRAAIVIAGAVLDSFLKGIVREGAITNQAQIILIVLLFGDGFIKTRSALGINRPIL